MCTSRIAAFVLVGTILVAQVRCGGSKTPASPTPPTAPSGTPGIQADANATAITYPPEQGKFPVVVDVADVLFFHRPATRPGP